MSDSDFRAQRVRLPPESFLIAPETEEEPSDLIDEETWRSLVWLPDDVSIRTSDHHGSLLRDADNVWGHWISLVLDVQQLLETPSDDPLQLAALSATDEWQASVYSAFTGFYRQAIACLRPALEAIVAGAYFRAFPDPLEAQKWADGDERHRLWLSEARRKLAAIEPYSKFDGFLDDDGWCAWIYRTLSAFQHGRPSLTDAAGQRVPTSNAQLWRGSNGPVYDTQAFNLWGRLYFNTLLLSVLLVGLAEPRLLTMERPSNLHYVAFLDFLWRAHPEPGVFPAATPVAKYLAAKAGTGPGKPNA